MTICRAGGNGLPHQCEHWFAMTCFYFSAPLVCNDALYASAYDENTPCASFGAQGVFWDSRRSDKTPETGGFSFKEALIKSARAGSERFCSQARFGKWRNTVCISHFSNRSLGAKDPLSSRRRFIQSFLRKPGARRRTRSRCRSPDRRKRHACRNGSWRSPRSPARSRERGCQW